MILMFALSEVESVEKGNVVTLELNLFSKVCVCVHLGGVCWFLCSLSHVQMCL